MEPWEFSHVFPRPIGGGVIIGGIKVDNDWSPEVDQKRVEIIKERACQLCPQLGKPDELQIIRHNIGLRRTSLLLSPELMIWYTDDSDVV